MLEEERVRRALLAEGRDKERLHGGGEEVVRHWQRKRREVSTKGERREEADWWSENKIQDRETMSTWLVEKKRMEKNTDKRSLQLRRVKENKFLHSL